MRNTMALLAAVLAASNLLGQTTAMPRRGRV